MQKVAAFQVAFEFCREQRPALRCGNGLGARALRFYKNGQQINAQGNTNNQRAGMGNQQENFFHGASSPQGVNLSIRSLGSKRFTCR